jgi:hypothetical protein
LVVRFQSDESHDGDGGRAGQVEGVHEHDVDWIDILGAGLFEGQQGLPSVNLEEDLISSTILLPDGKQVSQSDDQQNDRRVEHFGKSEENNNVEGSRNGDSDVRFDFGEEVRDNVGKVILTNHPAIEVMNITDVQCNEYIVIEFSLDSDVIWQLQQVHHREHHLYYDIWLLGWPFDASAAGKSLHLQILSAFPLPWKRRRLFNNGPFKVTFYPWNVDALSNLDGEAGRWFVVQVRVLDHFYRPLFDASAGLWYSSVSHAFSFPFCRSSSRSSVSSQDVFPVL